MIKKTRITVTVLLLTLISLHGFSQNLPKPAARQLNWQQLETNAFLHFTVNTFTDKEWGDGTESPAIFNPIKVNVRQWIKALKEAGFKMAIITAKHHDGFCLWPSKYTAHTVKNISYKKGKGDIVKEVADACKEYRIKFSFYLSPWDRHEPSMEPLLTTIITKISLKNCSQIMGKYLRFGLMALKGRMQRICNTILKVIGHWCVSCNLKRLCSPMQDRTYVE